MILIMRAASSPPCPYPANVRAELLGPAAIDAEPHEAPVVGARARLGFPSPADDFLDDGVDLHRLLIRNPPATYLYRAEGDSMRGAGICDGDVLVVDRSVRPQPDDVVIATWDGQQPACKIFGRRGDRVLLRSAHPDAPEIELAEDIEVELFVVVGVARQMRRGDRVRPR